MSTNYYVCYKVDEDLLNKIDILLRKNSEIILKNVNNMVINTNNLQYKEVFEDIYDENVNKILLKLEYELYAEIKESLEVFHIGKQTSNTFIFELGEFSTIDELRKILEDDTYVIRDEYGGIVSNDDFFEIIKNKKHEWVNYSFI